MGKDESFVKIHSLFINRGNSGFFSDMDLGFEYFLDIACSLPVFDVFNEQISTH